MNEYKPEPSSTQSFAILRELTSLPPQFSLPKVWVRQCRFQGVCEVPGLGYNLGHSSLAVGDPELLLWKGKREMNQQSVARAPRLPCVLPEAGGFFSLS